MSLPGGSSRRCSRARPANAAASLRVSGGAADTALQGPGGTGWAAKRHVAAACARAQRAALEGRCASGIATLPRGRTMASQRSAGLPSESARTVLDSRPYSDHALNSTQTSRLCDGFRGAHTKTSHLAEKIHAEPRLESATAYPHQPPATVTERNPMFGNRLTRMIASGAVIFGVGTIASLPATAATHRSHHHPHHPSHHASSGIPQHNGGDRDADNNGGPSDGDGNV
jgi:hypothetical protein